MTDLFLPHTTNDIEPNQENTMREIEKKSRKMAFDEYHPIVALCHLLYISGLADFTASSFVIVYNLIER